MIANFFRFVFCVLSTMSWGESFWIPLSPYQIQVQVQEQDRICKSRLNDYQDFGRFLNPRNYSHINPIDGYTQWLGQGPQTKANPTQKSDA